MKQSLQYMLDSKEQISDYRQVLSAEYITAWRNGLLSSTELNHRLIGMVANTYNVYKNAIQFLSGKTSNIPFNVLMDLVFIEKMKVEDISLINDRYDDETICPICGSDLVSHIDDLEQGYSEISVVCPNGCNTNMENQLKWQLAGAWNRGYEELAIKRQGESPRERTHLWASDLGKSHVDVYLKMKGVKPTNPPDLRALRKFEAGSMFEENVVKKVLQRIGILIDVQKRISHQYDGLLEVTGKLDFLAGGKIDVEKALFIVDSEFAHLPEMTKGVLAYTIKDLADKYPSGLEPLILELKTCSLSMFNRYESAGIAGKNHRLQIFHYLKGNNMTEGHVIYLCRDDLRMAQYGVFNPSVVEEEYKAYITNMTHYVMNGIQPENEDCIVWDEEVCKFSVNWKVMYSEYLTMLYKFAHQEEFRLAFEPQVRRMNTALKRYMSGANITKQNQEALDNISILGWDIDDLARQRSAIATDESEEEETVDVMQSI